MKRVQLEAVGWAFAGGVLLLLVGLVVVPWRVPLPASGWVAALAYFLVSTALLVRGFRRRGSARFGPANVVTAVRSTLVGLITGLVVASFTTPIPVALLIALVVPALALDAVDGWVARRTGTSSELGARFDMEVDAFLLLVLSAYVAQSLGPWVLAIGAIRYVFVMAGWALPWFRRRLPPRYWRKVVTAVTGIALAIAASGLGAGIDTVLVGFALVLLVESFGRDVIWLVRRRATGTVDDDQDQNGPMQQRISRVTTTDGTEVAVAWVGDGRPVVYVSGWLSHLQLGWELPEERVFYEGLAEGVRLVRYDRAGSGLSGAATRPPSLAYELDQLAAVVATLGPEPFDLIGTSMGAAVAVAWAAAHPDTVRRLVLYGGWVSGAAISSPSARDHILGLVESHWGLGSDVLTDIFAPDGLTGTRADFARYQRACSSAATARALLALSYELDIRDLLAQVRAPTLVVHRDHDRAAPVEQATALAAGIAGAQLVVLPGRSHLPYAGDGPALVAVIRRFLGLRAARNGGRPLTARQREVAALVSEGCTNREIATRLGIDERSAEGHVERIRLRLGFRSRAQIAAWYAAQPDRLGSVN